MATQPINRNDEIKGIWKEYRFFYQVAGGLLLVGIGVFIGMIAFSAPADRTGYLINLYTSILSILVTVFVIDFLNRRRDEHRDVRQLQEQLVRDASSTSNETAKNAIHQLRMRGWLEGQSSLLQGARLTGANLQDAKLSFANLQGAILFRANLPQVDLNSAQLQGVDLEYADIRRGNLRNTQLQRANLHEAQLQGAVLFQANLQEALLGRADLRETNFRNANLQKTDLHGSKLQGAILQGANLRMSVINGIELNEATILPDGKNWTPDTDMTRFGCFVM
jgi:uncharacterized protein YjbI with pentapeptide repeats